MKIFARSMRSVVVCALLAGGGAMAQTGADERPQTLSSIGEFPGNGPLTPEQIEANGEKSVILHFASNVTYWSTLQLVVLLQDYYRQGYRRFVLPIQTSGGSVNSAMYAYGVLKDMPVEITTVAVGYVDSAGVALYCLGDRRYAVPGSSFLFHPMSGSLTPDRRGQEAVERQIDNLSDWLEKVNDDCFGETPEAWDLDRRDYRVLAEEAREVGLVNADGSYFDDIDPIGVIAYVQPHFLPQVYGTR